VTTPGLPIEVGRSAQGEMMKNIEQIDESPRAELPEALPAPRRAAEDPLGDALTISDVAKMLRCCVWTVRKRYLPRGLPYFRVGSSGKLVFYRNQVTRWILKQQEIHNGRR